LTNLWGSIITMHTVQQQNAHSLDQQFELPKRQSLMATSSDPPLASDEIGSFSLRHADTPDLLSTAEDFAAVPYPPARCHKPTFV
jgi:hypothetical protein